MEASRLGACEGVVVVLDTSVILDIARGLIPISSIGDVVNSFYKLVIPSSVIDELTRIAESRGLKSRIARRALELLAHSNVSMLSGGGNVDEDIVSIALTLKSTCRVIVATNDRILRKRLRELGVPTMYYRRARGGLELEWYPL